MELHHSKRRKPKYVGPAHIDPDRQLTLEFREGNLIIHADVAYMQPSPSGKQKAKYGKHNRVSNTK